MSETSWSLIFTKGDSNGVDSSASLEELFNGPLLGSESEVSNENSGNSLITTLTLWLVASSGLS